MASITTPGRAACMALVCLLTACAPGEEPRIDAGREQEIVALIAPFRMQEEIVPGLKVGNVRIEAAAIVFLVEGDRTRAALRLEWARGERRRHSERTRSFALVREGDVAAAAAALDALADAVRVNDAGGFWPARPASRAPLVFGAVGFVSALCFGARLRRRRKPLTATSWRHLLPITVAFMGSAWALMRSAGAGGLWPLLTVPAAALVGAVLLDGPVGRALQRGDGSRAGRWQVAGSGAGGLLLALAIPLPLPQEPRWLAPVALAAHGTTLGLLLLAVAGWGPARPAPGKAVAHGRWTWLWPALPCIAVWTSYLLAFWPGVMNVDAMNVWTSAVSGRFGDDHPAMNGFTVWLLTRLWPSPAAVAFGQIAALAVTFALLLRELGSWGVPVRVRAAAAALFALTPVNGAHVVALIKDVPYTIAMLGVAVALLRAARSDGDWLARWPGRIALATPLALVALYRHNGVPTVVVIVGITLVVLWRQWRAVATTALVTAAMVLAVRGPVYRLLEVQPMEPAFALQLHLHQIAELVTRGVPLTPEQESLLASIQPLDTWRSSTCESLDPVVYNSEVYATRETIALRHEELHSLWRELVWRHPGLLAEHVACKSAMIWRLRPPRGGYFYGYDDMGIYPNAHGIEADRKLPRLAQALETLLAAFSGDAVSPLSWRPAAYLYSAVFFTIVAAARTRRRALLLFLAPAVANTLVMVALITVPHFRFQYPVYVMGLLAPLLLWVSVPPRTGTPEDRSGGGVPPGA